MNNISIVIFIFIFVFFIVLSIIYISIRFWGYYLGSIKYYAECSYYKKQKLYGDPKNYF